MGRRLIQNGGLSNFVDLNQVDFSDLQILIDAVLSNANLGSQSQLYNSSWFRTIEPLGWSTYDKFKFLLVTLEDIPLALGTGRGWTSDDGGPNGGNYALGFGFDPYQRRATLYSDLVAAGISLPNDPAIINRLRSASSLTQSGMNTLMRDLLTGRTISFAQAANLFSAIDDDYERRVDALYSNLPPSIERAVVFDLRYQGYLLAGSGSGSAKDNYRHELYGLLDRGDFIGAAVKLALTDGNVVVNGNYQRDVTRARVLLFSQMLTDNRGLLASTFDLMDLLPALAGQPLNVPVTDKAFQASLDIAATLRAQLGEIRAWEASANASGDQQLINARNEFLNDVLTNSQRVLEAHGFHLNSGQSTSLSQAAAAAHVPTAHLQTIYGDRSFGAYEVFLVPYGTPSEIVGDRTLAGMPPAEIGQRRVVKYDHDSSNFVTFITRAVLGDPAVTFVNQSDRTLLAIENPAIVVGYERVGNGYRVRLADGDSILVTSTSDSSGEHVRAEYTSGTGGPPVIINVDPDRPLVVGIQGSLFFRNNYYGGQWAAMDFNNVPGLSNPYLLAKILGRADAPEGMGGEGPLIALEDIIDPDGPVSYEVRINPDGTKESVTTFYLNNGTSGLGDRVVQVAKQSVFGGQDVTTYSSVTRFGDDATVTYVRDQAPSQEPIELVDPEVDIYFQNHILTLEAFGSIFGSNIGRFLAGSNVAAQVALGAVLSTVSGNLGELADNLLNDVYGLDGVTPLSAATKIEEALKDIGDEFLQNLKTAGAGALSSFLLSEIFEAIGIGGVPAELGQAVGGAYLTATIEALPELIAGTTSFGEVFQGINPLSIAASWLGSTLASEIVEFDTIGGQLGSSIGSAVGALAGSALAIKYLGTLGAALAGPIGALVGAFVGFLVGGLIGSLFGGTPRSGADVAWDASTGEFFVANAYARKGGSKEAAISVSEAAANIYNSVLQATQSKLLAPETVQAGNFGMWKKDWIYRPISTQSESSIESRFHNPDDLIAYGVAKGLKDIVINAAGGDVFVKRALFSALDASDGSADGYLTDSLGDFGIEQIVGAISVARDFAMFTENSKVISAAIANDPNGDFALGWATTLAMAADLRLDRRGVTDWIGGYAIWLDELDDGKFDGVAVSVGIVEMNFNFATNGREWLILKGNGSFRGKLTDDIAIDMQTIVNGSTEWVVGDVIDLRTETFGGIGIKIAAIVFANEGDDIVHASNLGDNIFGGEGNDALYGGRLDDWLLGDDGNDVLDAGTQDQSELGGDGNYLNGGAGNDTLRGREGSDWLEGGEGTDVITGGAGDDILAGGADDADDLKGGIGFDQYLVRLGDGLDLAEEDAYGALVSSGEGDAITQRISKIEAWKANPATVGAIRPDWVGTSAGVQAGAVSGGEDSVVFGAGIGIGDIKLQRSGTSGALGNDLIVMVMQTVAGVETFSGTQLTIRDWFTNPFKRVEWLKFIDGNEIRIGDITSFIVGGSGNDVLIGTTGNDFVYGGAGNDKLYLLAGDDIGNGGIGDDMVAGDSGRDLLIGGLGNDELIGGAGSDAITGDAGADDIYGGADRDTLSGGRGDGDMVVGGAGDDTFRYARGDGRDTYFDEFAGYWGVVWTSAGGWNTAGGYAYNATTGEVTGPGGIVIRKNLGTVAEPDFQWLGRYDYDSATQTLKFFAPPVSATTITANAGVDTIEFAPGINLQDVILRRPNGTNDLVLAISSENEELGDTSLARDSVTIRDWYLAPGQIEKLAFYQTGILDITAASKTLIAGTDGADGSMSTPLQGTVGADWITGAAGDDVIAAGTGNDILAGNSGFDTLKGEAGDDVLYGGTGNDMLDGGSGKDVLVGGAGQDTASYASASAAVRAQLSAQWANAGDAAGDEFYGIEDLTGGSGADVLGGDSGQNELTGGAGNDSLQGNAGDDTYVWNVGDGADTINEGSFVVQEAVTAAGELAAGFTVSRWEFFKTTTIGQFRWILQITGPDGSIVYTNSTFIYPTSTGVPPPVPASYIQAGWLGGFARTNGQQVTRQLFDPASNGGNDELEFGPNISLNDLTFVQSGNDLIVRYGDSSASQVTIKDQLLAASAIETLKFSDGLSVSLASVLIAASSAQLVGTAGDDLLVGQAGVLIDTLAGGDGNDTLAGYAGNDVLSGGNGDDVLEGGLGADTLDGGAHVVPADGPTVGDTARYVRSAAAVTINLNQTTAQTGAAGADSIGDVLVGIENVTGSVFGDTITGNGADNRLFGHDGADTISGGAGSDVLTGDGGNDNLYGDAGEDNIAGGDGNDTIYGGTENDALDGGDGVDLIFGETGNDSLTGGAGADTLNGGDGDDILSGDADNDSLAGGAGNDVLAGGTGSDMLSGGVGNDRYVLGRNSGSDTISDVDGINAIQFDSSVSYNQIWLTRVGNDLRVAVIGGDTVAMVVGFFLAAGGSKIKAIESTTHAIFLDHHDTLNIITAMTAATATPAVSPVSIPASVAGLLATYWHAGGKAVPTGPATARTFTLAEDGTLAIDGNYGVIDHDQNVVSYAIKTDGGPAKGTISNLNPATGALTYTPFANATGLDSFVVVAIDADGQAVELTVSVSITAVNDAPVSIAVKNGALLVVAESTPAQSVSAGTIIGEFESVDPEGDLLTFALVNDAGQRFALSADGKLSVANPAAIDFEAAASHTIRVRVSDSNGASHEQDFVVNVQNGNEQNLLNAALLSVSENVALGTVVGTMAASDLDISGDYASQRYYFWDGTSAASISADGRYAIDAATGQITVNSALNFEGAESSRTYQVIARDNAGSAGYNQAQSAVTISITDLNEVPISLNWTPLIANVAERDKVATATLRPAISLGTLSVNDPDTAGLPGASYTYGVSDSRFEFVGSTLRLRQNAAFDFETEASVSVTVTGTDQTGSPFTITRVISFVVTDQDDILEGTSGNDTFSGQQGRDIISGFAGNDILNGNAGDDNIDGGDGADQLNGGAGVDTLLGQGGSDIIYGGSEADTLRGGDGDDRLLGEDGHDAIYGDAGSDGTRAVGSESWRGFTQAGLIGGAGNDYLHGGDGDDYLDGGAGADQLIGSLGFDGVDYSASTLAVTVNLTTGTGSGGDAQGDTLSGIELVQGSALGDAITGTAGSDTIYGGAGNDVILGGAGNDYLFGGDGNDTINAEAGDDMLDGGAGDDVLNGGIDNDLYIVTRSSGADTINNYDPSGDDVDVIGFNDAGGAIAHKDLWFERIGNDLKITVIATGSSVQVTNWYTVTDAASRANHKIDFIIAGTSYSKTINIEGLVTLMAGKTKPATLAARDTLMEDLVYKANWATYWDTNAAPVLTAITQQVTNEDTARTFSVTATDDITPNAQVNLSVQVLSGTNVVADADITFGAADANGVRTMTINPADNASGTARIRVTATDAGGVSSSQDFDIVVGGVADTPTVEQFTSPGGTSGYPEGIALNLHVAFPDVDGSESQRIWITGVPAGVTLSAGTYDSASATWKLSVTQLSNLKLLAPAAWSQDITLTATGRATENGQTAISDPVVLTIAVNAPPTGASFSGSVNENAANGTAVATVVGIDPDAGDLLTFSLTDTAGGRFAISNSGAVSVANGILLNFETTTSHSIMVRITDSHGEFIDRSFAIAVSNVNEANTVAASSTFYLDENVAAGAIVGTVAAGDVDSGATVFGQQRYYFWNGASAQTTSFDGRFTIDAVTGVITSNAAFNFEIDPNTQHRVIARDNAGNAGFNQVETQVNINLNNINEANSWPAPSTFAINENVVIGTVLGTVTAFDLDSSATVFGQQRYYFWNGSAASATSFDGRYAIDAVTGQIRTAAALDFEAGSTSVSYTVVARDSLGNPGYSQASTTVTIAVNNLNEANSMPASYSMVIDENVGIGTLVGVVAASDIDSAAAAFGQQRYYFWDGSAAGVTSSDGRYVIDAVTGQIRTASAINFEAGNITASYTVIARDNLGNAGYTQVSSTVTIGLQDVNEAHVLASASGSQAEVTGLPPLTTIFDLRSSMLQDPEGRNMTWTFADGSNQNGIWTLSPDGKLSLTAGGVDYETLTTAYSGWVPYRDYSLATQALAVRAYDGQHSVTGTFTAQITDVNEGPSLGWSPRFIVHDDQSDGLLGTLQGFDPETGDAATSYSITVRSATESFLSQGGSSDVDNTGNPTVWVGAGGKLYFDTPSDGEWEGGIRYHPIYGGRWYYQLDYIVDVTMTDASGVSRTESFTITFLKHDTSGILPIVLDLDGDGLELVAYETSTVTFDMDLDGIADRTGWVGADDGMLVLDRNSNGIIDNSLEISFTRDDQNALTDLEGLRAWDTNRDGLLDAGDDDFTRFQIWRDVNQNGISEAGELFSLGALGITELNLTLNLTGNELVNDTNVIFATSEYFTSDGSSGIVGDVSFAFDPSKVDPDETSSLAAPIVFDLDDDSAGLIQLSASETRFDMNGDGIADNTGWIEAGDAFLALDRNGNGFIDDISEISFVGDKEGAKTDLEGLVAFDTNADGVMDGEDERFVEFKLWLDGNSNGRTDAGELLSLAEAGVTSISLSGAATGETPVAGRNIVFNTGSFTRAGGALGTLLDAGLAFTARSALPEIEFQESTWDGKSKRYRLSAGSGLVRVAPRNANGLLSADAGQLAGAAHIMFKNQTIGMLSTIVIDLDGDGLEAKQASKIKALFDMNGDGARDDTGWASGGDGMLVIDRDADGAITDVSEISFLSEKDGARNAWEGLAELDNTRDGKLDASDARFGALKVWVDRNGDGISQSDELRSLADLGISEIGLRNFATSDSVKPGQNLALSTATFKWENGVTGTIGNLAMAFTPSARGRVPATRSEGEPVVVDIMALRAASNLAQAMSTFGTEASQGDLRLLDVNGNAPQDWLTATAV